jgi:predicted 3-demethylubiquinone-9 3-methyltransferase (glyoxalase superfamily)
MPKITPFLWFDTQAEEAAKFYVSIFKRDSKIKAISRYGDSGPGPKGSVMTVAFRLDGQDFVALNGGPAFKFTEAVSFWVACDSQEEIDTFWRKLSKGGKEIQCGWLKDKYGLCWQIVPSMLPDLLDARYPDRSERVMKAVMGMVKLDVAALKRAYMGASSISKRRK